MKTSDLFLRMQPEGCYVHAVPARVCKRFSALCLAVAVCLSSQAAKWQGGETGSWQDAANWNSSDYMSGGQIWMTLDHAVHTTTDADIGVPNNISWLFHNAPDCELDLRNHTFYMSILALGCANDGNNLNPVPKATFRNGTIACTNDFGEYVTVDVRIPTAGYTGFERADYTFDSIRFPNVKLTNAEGDHSDHKVLFTNCVINSTGVSNWSRWNRYDISYQDCIVTNYIFKDNRASQPSYGNTLAFDRSIYYGQSYGDYAAFNALHAYDSTITVTNRRYFVTDSCDMKRTTVNTCCGVVLGYCGGGLVRAESCTFNDTNGQFPVEILSTQSIQSTPLTNTTVVLKNTTANVAFDETVDSQYWGAMIGYGSSTPIDCTLVTENFKFLITNATPVMARFYMGNMSNFTWRVVGGGTLLKHCFTGDPTWDGSANTCQIGSSMTGDSKIVFEVPKKGMKEPGLTLEFPSTVGWHSAFARVVVDAQKWVNRTGGEVCLLKSNVAFTWTSIKNLFKDAVLPLPAKEGDEVKLEFRNNDLEVWLVAPEVHSGMTVVIK